VGNAICTRRERGRERLYQRIEEDILEVFLLWKGIASPKFGGKLSRKENLDQNSQRTPSFSQRNGERRVEGKGKAPLSVRGGKGSHFVTHLRKREKRPKPFHKKALEGQKSSEEKREKKLGVLQKTKRGGGEKKGETSFPKKKKKTPQKETTVRGLSGRRGKTEGGIPVP